MKTLMLVLGNGFSIDLLHHLNIATKIDLVNLFSRGDTVVWPDGSNEKGFLSYKHCPYLWSLGARPYMDNDSASELVEDIITCANMISNSSLQTREQDLYINAYYELAIYLKHLFIHYNSLVSNADLLHLNGLNWGWLDLISRTYKNREYSKIVIVTYNYDIFLERLLKLNRMRFQVYGKGNQKSCKIIILKPHGSISFTHENVSKSSVFSIRRSEDMYEAALSNFNIKYSSLDADYLVNAMIPPAGDSSRLSFKWASEIREQIAQEINNMNAEDKVVISGLSYWHVDRREIDELITKFAEKNLGIYMVNPKPPRALNAVLSCVSPNHITYTSSDCLKGVK